MKSKRNKNGNKLKNKDDLNKNYGLKSCGHEPATSPDLHAVARLVAIALIDFFQNITQFLARVTVGTSLYV